MKHNAFMVFILNIVVFSFLLNLYGYSTENSYIGVSMKVSGRFIQKETGKGISGVYIRIFDNSSGFGCDAVSDNNGYFEIKKVQPGNYEAYVSEIHRTCPPDLILEKDIEPFVVKNGRNINRNIFLIKGASIAGRAFLADGITPITKGIVSVANAFRGKTHEIALNNEGRFKVLGLGSLESAEFNCKVIAQAPGYANSFRLVKLMTGEQKENVDFVIGKGDIHVQGKVVSVIDCQPVKNAKIYVISLDRDSKKLADGFTITNDSGNYSIIGFENTGEVEISVFHDNYKMIEKIVELKKGINIFNIELNQKKDSSKKKDMKLTSGDLNECKCENDKVFQTYRDVVCTLTNEDSYNCIKNLASRNCMREKCKRKIIVICKKKCSPDPFNGVIPCGTVEAMNIDVNKNSEIKICFNANTECGAMHPLNTVFHELFHTCDRDAEKDYKTLEPCSEFRAHTATGCILDDDFSREEAKKNKLLCITVKG